MTRINIYQYNDSDQGSSVGILDLNSLNQEAITSIGIVRRDNENYAPVNSAALRYFDLSTAAIYTFADLLSKQDISELQRMFTVLTYRQKQGLLNYLHYDMNEFNEDYASSFCFPQGNAETIATQYNNHELITFFQRQQQLAERAPAAQNNGSLRLLANVTSRVQQTPEEENANHPAP